MAGASAAISPRGAVAAGADTADGNDDGMQDSLYVQVTSLELCLGSLRYTFLNRFLSGYGFPPNRSFRQLVREFNLGPFWTTLIISGEDAVRCARPGAGGAGSVR